MSSPPQQIPLLLGSGLIAFGPLLSMFGMIVYHKAQLVILVTTSAFFQLLAITVASILSYGLYVVIYGTLDPSNNNDNNNGGGGNGPAAILPAIVTQFLFRCAYVHMYHKVEAVIQNSLHQQITTTTTTTREETNNNNNNNNDDDNEPVHQNNNNNTNNNNTTTVPVPSRPSTNNNINNNNSSSNNNNNSNAALEATKLRLQLNDASAAIASSVGFGGMNGLMLYGTLLASESYNNIGVLYEPSCPNLPSIVHSAILANFFFLLQIFWMLFTFFGMRRRWLYHRGENSSMDSDQNIFSTTTTTRNQSFTDNNDDSSIWANSRSGGNWALLTVLITHLLASLATLANGIDRGCMIALPSVGAIVLLTMYLFWAQCGRHYMPPNVVNNYNNNLYDNNTTTNEAAAATEAMVRRSHLD